MANTLVTPSWVIKEVGRAYENMVHFIEKCRQYSNQYEFGGAKVGNTIQYRKPQRWVVFDGQALQTQPILDETVPITLSAQKQIGFEFSSAQATTEVEEVQKRYTKPAGASLASIADKFAFAACYPDVYNMVGTPGTTPSATLTYLQGGVKISDQSAPDSDRTAVLDTMAMATLANTSSTLFNPAGSISDNYRDGQFGSRQLGFASWYQDQNRPTHTTGTFTASTPIMASAGQTGSTISTTGWAAGASSLKRGDIFTIAGVFSVNRLSYTSTGRLQQFVVTADTSDAAGAMATLPISPSIVTSGPLQTVSGSAANGAAVTVWSANPVAGTLATTASPQSMLFHPEAFAFATADLVLPVGDTSAARIGSSVGNLALRIARQYNVQTDQNVTRIDTLIGAATLRPEWASRVVG
jgi:hypothetical protein